MTPASNDTRYAAIIGRLKLRHLRLIDAIVEAHSISGAAARLHITQPAVSKGLREAEDILGVRLFERGPRGLALTVVGRAVVARSKAIQLEIRQVSDEIDALSSGFTGLVTVGAQLVALPTLVPAAVRLLRDRGVMAPVRVIEGTLDALVEQLRAGAVDLIVGRLPPVDRDQRLVQEVLGQEPIVVVAGAGHPLARRARVRHRDLAQADWVFPPPGSPARAPVMQLFTQHGLARPPGYVETTSYLTVRALLIEHGMVAALPRRTVMRDVEAGWLRILPLAFSQESLAVGLTMAADVPPSPAAQRLVECLREAARAEAAGLAQREP